MLNSRLDPSQKFETWAAQILSYNVSLRNTTSHMSEDQLRTQLEAALDEELRAIATEEKLTLVTDLRKWMGKIRDIDNRRQLDRKRMSVFWDEKMRAAKRHNTGTQYPSSTRNGFTRGNNAISASASTTYPPKLTDDKRKLLHEHEGCLKCRVFYAGHQADKCSVTLSGKDYKQRTVQDALRAKAAKSTTRAPPVASITEFTTDNSTASDLVAAIFPASTSVSSDNGSSDVAETSLSSVSANVPPPLKSKHLIWQCMLMNLSDNLRVKTRALIDSGAHMVLIHPNLVAQL